MSTLNSIIKFYRDCYLHDYKSISLANFFSRKVTHRLSLETFEILGGNYSSYPINSSWASEVDAELAIYGQEKALFVGSLFIKGTFQQLGKNLPFFCPLYLHEAQLSFEQDVYTISPDLDNPIINPQFLNFLDGLSNNLTFEHDDLRDALPFGSLQFENLIQLKKVFERFLPNLKLQQLDQLILSETAVVDPFQAYKSKSEKYTNALICGASVGLLEKPKGSRGILNELNILAEEKNLPNLFSKLFNEQEIPHIPSKERKIHIPISLSQSQREVFYAIDKNDVILVNGPPGTGKSLTIAALAADFIHNGKSVLIGSKNNQAGKVIYHKIEKDLGLKGIAIQTVKRAYKRSLKSRISKVVSGTAVKRVERHTVIFQAEKVDRIQDQILNLQKLLSKREKQELKWGKFYSEYSQNIFSVLKSKWVEYLQQKAKPLTSILEQLKTLEKTRIKTTKKLILSRYKYNLYKKLFKKRAEFKSILRAFEQDSGMLTQEILDEVDFDLVLNALPLWIVNSGDIHQVLPLKQELFDVLIIDEATQCDIASSLPMIFRAKKVIAVGDPQQLRHISFLSKKQETLIRENYLVPNYLPGYRANSLLDLVNESLEYQDQVIFLDEHYRSKPGIINFPNETFYDGNLKVMTSCPHSIKESVTEIIYADGSRNSKGENIAECMLIIEHLIEIVYSEEELGSDLAHSIGILSPFRNQVNLLKTILREKISLPYLKKHKILIGTPFEFQGEERDLMFISFVLDKDAHHASIRYLDRSDVFNVSITRSRNRQLIYHSLDLNMLNPDLLIVKYIQNLTAKKEIINNEDYLFDSFLSEVKKEILLWEVENILIDYPVAGLNVDLVVLSKGKTYCIDLVGYPGSFESILSIERIQMLFRMDKPLFLLPYSSWNLEREKMKDELKVFLERDM